MSTYEWIMSITAIISCASIIFAAITILYGHKKEKDHYDSYRRLNTINFMSNWNHSLADKIKKSEKIVNTFDLKTCRKLYNLEPVELEKNEFDCVCELCSKNNGTCKDCIVTKKGSKEPHYILKGTPVHELRGYTISYLNNLEILLLAWKLDIVDKDTISKQFKYLYNPSLQRNALENFRRVASNGLAYPVIDEFIKDLEETGKASVKAVNKRELGKIFNCRGTNKK